MKARVIQRPFDGREPVARLNRRALRNAGVLAVGLAGDPGCGKTSLIAATIERLMPDLRAGVVACDLDSRADARRLSAVTDQVVEVNTGGLGAVDAARIADALRWLDLSSLDLLFIENIGTLTLESPPDLGQDSLVTVFSVAGGDDKAERHGKLVAASDLVILNKTDLLPCVPFDLVGFGRDVRRRNPGAPCVEVSALRGTGLDQWLQWLRSRPSRGAAKPSHWFG